MAIFKPADPSRRMPVWLQAYTKENFIWQIKLAVVYLVGIYAHERVLLEIDKKKYQNTED